MAYDQRILHIYSGVTPGTGDTFYFNRQFDSDGILQIYALGAGKTYVGELYGRVSNDAPWYLIDTYDETQLVSNTFGTGVAIFPQMRFVLSGQTNLTDFDVWLAE